MTPTPSRIGTWLRTLCLVALLGGPVLPAQAGRTYVSKIEFSAEVPASGGLFLFGGTGGYDLYLAVPDVGVPIFVDNDFNAGDVITTSITGSLLPSGATRTTYAEAVKVIRNAYFYSTYADFYCIKKWQATIVVNENGTEKSFSHSITSTLGVWLIQDSASNPQRIEFKACADKLEGRYDTPLDVTYPSDLIVPVSGTARATFDVWDPDGAVTAVVESTSDPSLLPTSGIAVSGTGAKVYIDVTPAAGKFGNASLNIKFSQGNWENKGTLAVRVQRASVEPTLVLGPDTAGASVRKGSTRSFSYTVHDDFTKPADLYYGASWTGTATIPANAITFAGTNENRIVNVNAALCTVGTTEMTLIIKNRSQSGAWDKEVRRTFTLSINQDADIQGRPNWSNGTTALRFNGTSDMVRLPKGTWVGGAFTMEGWVRLNSHHAWAPLMEVGNGSAGSLALLCLSYLDATGKASLHVTDSTNQRRDLIATRSLPLNQWVHVAATVENGKGRIYYDGEQVAEGDMPTPAGVERSENAIGRSTLSTTAFVDGVMDDVRLWSVARTAEEIRNARFPLDPTSDAGKTFLGDATIVGYWPMNQTSGESVPQAATQTHSYRPADATGSALAPVWVPGLPNLVAYTVDEDSSQTTVPLRWTGPSGGTWQIGQAPFGGTTTSSSGPMSLSSGTTYAGQVSYAPSRDFNSGNPARLLDGMTLTARDYNGNDLPPLRIQFTVRPVNDVPRGGSGTYLQLSGGYARADASGTAASRPLGLPFTLEAVINPSSSGGPILAKKGEYYLGLDGSNRVRFFRGDRASAALVTLNSLRSGEFTHIAATFGDTFRRIYVNGELVIEDVSSGDDFQVVSSTSNLLIGSTDLSSEPRTTFLGGIDEVRVWNLALTADQIRARMSRSLAGSEEGLIAYYRFDEGQGITVYDSRVTATPLDGSLSGIASWGTRSDASVFVTVDEDAATEIVLPATDVDRQPALSTGARDALTYTIRQQPANGTILRNSGDGTVTYKPKANFAGSDSFTYVVSDGGGESQLATVRITVVSVNDVPTVEPLPNLILPDGQGAVTLAVNITDNDGPQSPAINQVSVDQPNLLPRTNVVVLTNATTGKLQIQITPQVGVYGTARVTLNITDGSANVLAGFNVTFIPSLSYAVIDLTEATTSSQAEPLVIDESSRVGGSIGASSLQRGLLYGKLLEGGAVLDSGMSNLVHRVTSLSVSADLLTSFDGGSYVQNNIRRAYRNVGGVTKDLGWNYGSEVTAINRRGTVVGVATNSGAIRAFTLPRSVDQLTASWLLPFVGGVATAIDAADNVFGWFPTNGVEHAWRYSNLGEVTFIPPPSSYKSSRIQSASDDGATAAGYLVKQNDGRSHAAIYFPGSATWRVVNTNWISSKAYGVNAAQQSVGEAEVSGGVTHAFLYMNGQAYDLNTLLGPDSEWTLVKATAINNLGQIVGVGQRRLASGSYESRAFLAVPANVIGNPVPRPLGAVARSPIIDLLESKPTDTPQQSLIWSEVEKTLFAVRPVKARISWPTSMDPTATNATYVKVFAANIWPKQPQIHAAGAPVITHPEVSPWPYAFFNMEFCEVPGGTLDQQTKVFNCPSNSTGYSVFRYLKTGGLPADVNSQSNAFTVTRTYTVPQLLSNQVDVAWPIGFPLTNQMHAELSGRNGFVFYPKTVADLDESTPSYDRAERRGSIVAVNELNPRPPVNDQDLVVVWYALNNLGVAWAERPVRYRPYWPTNAPHVVIASTLGTSPHGLLTASFAPSARIYNQPDPALSGFNPNEEHSLLVGDTAYALRCDLNDIKGYSKAYLLVKYLHPDLKEARFFVYKVVAEEDPYYFRYSGIAGNEVQPPLPLSVLPLAEQNYIAAGHNIALEDYKGKIYARAAGVRGALDSSLVLRFYYPYQPGFYWTGEYGSQVDTSTFLPWLDRLAGGVVGRPVDVRYEIRWPDDAPVLEVGETLMRSKHGLPAVMDMASARLVYDSLNSSLTNAMRIGPGAMTQAPTNLTRLYDPISERYVKLATTFTIPDSIKTGAGSAGRVVFPDLPYPLRLRLSYDPLNKWMYWKGILDESGIGEPLLLPNIISSSELTRIQDLDGKNNNSKWDDAIQALYIMTRNPNELDLDKTGGPDNALLVGLQYKVATTNYVGGRPVYTYDTDYLTLESLPAGPKALTGAIGNNVPEPPRPGYAATFNNSLLNYLKVTNMPSGSLQKLTWEAWVNRSGANSEDIVLSWGRDANGLQAGFDSRGYFYFRLNGDTAWSEDPYRQVGEWHHWAGAYDMDASSLFIYRDGEVVGRLEVVPRAWNVSGELRIGSGTARDDRAGFYGMVDEVRVWTGVARPYSQIAAWRYQKLLAKTAGLAGYWQMDDQTSQVADSSGWERVARKNGIVDWTSAEGQEWGIPARFVTLIENDDTSLAGLPVSLKVIQIGPGPFAGDLKVLYGDNVFDERLTLRASSDFAGQPEDFEFEWYYKPDAADFSRSELPEIDPSTGELTDAHGWIPYVSGFGSGKNSITIGEGGESGLLTLSDNWFICRYRGYNVGSRRDVWSPWIGDPSSKSEPWPMLAEGWVKRVIRGLNPFDERVSDLSSAAASTRTSMIQQAGQRYEGDIAFNPDASNLNRIGLIEAYETVLRRARSLSTDGTPAVNFQPANNALLLVASRIADIYTLLGNEAYADASDPTVGFTTDGGNAGPYGTFASSIFAFQNQVDSLLDEELGLLRGRDNTSAGVQGTPLYNRLFWNFTLGDGEVAYVNVYNVSDQNGDGKIDEKDARILYPQGHGDAWGHYLTAAKTYYGLLRNANFTWVPRSESVLVAGVPVKVDYLDERKFALACASKARMGAEIVDLTYRKNYVEDPAGQWQGYRDTDEDRAWGVGDWAVRASHASLFDWVTVNAIIPAVDPNPSHSGLDRIDRQTVLEIKEIASAAELVVSKIDAADNGLNPLGLAKGVVPFDIDPAAVDSGVTHFEQIYQRASDALGNTLMVFNEVNSMSQAIRANEDSTEAFSREVESQEREFSSRLIEIFGYPYAGDIGPGKTYLSGYDGPDLVHYMYVNTKEINPGNKDASAELTGFFKFLNDDDEKAGLTLDDTTEQLRQDMDTTSVAAVTASSVNYPMSAGSYLFEAPASWGMRRAPGELQISLSDLVQADARLKQAIKNYDALIGEIRQVVNGLDGQYDSFAAKELEVLQKSRGSKVGVIKKLADMESAQIAMNRVSTAIMEAMSAAEEGVPKVVGLATDATSGIRAALGIAALVGKFGSDITSDALGIAMTQTSASQEVDALDEEIQLKSFEATYEAQQDYQTVLTYLRQEPALRLEMYTQKEVVEQTFGRYLSALASGQRLLEERTAFRRKTAGNATKVRYRDMAYRIFRNDAIQKYRAQFDLAARYVYLAAAAYDYESNLLGNEGKAGRKFFTDIVRHRAPGAMIDGVPLPSQQGLASPLARMAENFKVMKTQMGFNNPQTETGRFSLRHELFRIKSGPDSDVLWREQLKKARVENLWQVPEFRRFCRPMAPESLGSQPAIVVRFPTMVTFGMNYFGWPLSGGDSAYDPTQFATKIRSAGIWFSGYDGNGMSMTPRVYLFPVGADVLRSPNGDNFETRLWRVIDQKIPLPFPISETDIRNPKFIPANDSISGNFVEIRKFSSLRAYHDGGNFDESQAISDSRLIGRSVWNTSWLLVIPGGTLLNNADQGLDTFIHSVSDIKVFFQTYAYSGN
jgi:probable HAF family extracellular repeat protein